MKISDEGIALIKKFEGFSAKPYKCPAGIWTIGYGSTVGVSKDSPRITEAEAEELLRRDVAHAEEAVRRLAPRGLNQNQIDALISFVFNLGAGALARSTLLKHLNKSNSLAAAGEFQKWCFANGKQLDGLLRRRLAERDLFMKKMIVADNGRVCA